MDLDKRYYVNAQRTGRPPLCYGDERDLVDQGRNPNSDKYIGLSLKDACMMYDSGDQWKREAGGEIVERAGLQDCGSIALDMPSRNYPRATVFSDGEELFIIRPDTGDKEHVHQRRGALTC
ncbi:MAG: hypothetical protein R6V10_01785 [bacterium]